MAKWEDYAKSYTNINNKLLEQMNSAVRAKPKPKPKPRPRGGGY